MKGFILLVAVIAVAVGVSAEWSLIKKDELKELREMNAQMSSELAELRMTGSGARSRAWMFNRPPGRLDHKAYDRRQVTEAPWIY